MQQTLLQRTAQKSQGLSEKQKRKLQKQLPKPEKQNRPLKLQKKLQNKKKQDLRSEFLLFLVHLIKRFPLILQYFTKDSELRDYIFFIFRNKNSSPQNLFQPILFSKHFLFPVFQNTIKIHDIMQSDQASSQSFLLSEQMTQIRLTKIFTSIAITVLCQ